VLGDLRFSSAELFVMLRACLYENTTIELSERQVKMVVDATFDDLDTDKDGKISFGSFPPRINDW
jgi:Ca2+-binding EF-hand superfamily protein